jgi:hypothetical protein
MARRLSLARIFPPSPGFPQWPLYPAKVTFSGTYNSIMEEGSRKWLKMDVFDGSYAEFISTNPKELIVSRCLSFIEMCRFITDIVSRFDQFKDILR